MLASLCTLITRPSHRCSTLQLLIAGFNLRVYSFLTLHGCTFLSTKLFFYFCKFWALVLPHLRLKETLWFLSINLFMDCFVTHNLIIKCGRTGLLNHHIPPFACLFYYIYYLLDYFYIVSRCK